MPCQRFLPFEKLFLCGLGPRAEFNKAGYVAAVENMLSTFEAARIRAAVCALPGRTTDAIDPEDAITSLLVCARNHSDSELTILDEPSAQRIMEPVIAHERRRERAEP